MKMIPRVPNYGLKMQMVSNKIVSPVIIFSAILIVALSHITTYGSCRGYGMRDLGNRFEGNTVQLNALTDFTFVALHRQFEPFSKDSTLNVHFFLPKFSTDDSKVFLEALELQDSQHYLMCSKQEQWEQGAWNIFRNWSTKDVIDSLGIASQNLGVRAAVQIGNKTRLYLPVDLYSKPNQIKELGYTFYYVTAQDLQSIDISVTNTDGQPAAIAKPILECNKKRNPNCVLYAAGSTFSFRLDFSPVKEGQYSVHLIGRIPRTSEATSTVTRIYHAPKTEKTN